MLKAYVLDFAEIFACVKTKNGVNTSFEKKLFCLSNMDSGSAEEHTVVISPTVGRNGLKAAKEFRIMVDRPWPDDDAVPSEEKNSATLTKVQYN